MTATMFPMHPYLRRPTDAAPVAHGVSMPAADRAGPPSATPAPPSVVEMVFTGDLDARRAAALRTTIIETLTRDRPASIVLDLSGLTFIDFEGVRLLYDVCAELAAAGCVLNVSRADGRVRWMLSTVGLEMLFGAAATHRRQSEPGS
ncbi:STAS domain-containing protein [Dactylosporangium sp. NPDC050588]|uniref:STAS domain-containing protein n=1 Tax=Dactylosporangium sp. NPDC050588 TaxID=3157211 RepID=UPI0033E27787